MEPPAVPGKPSRDVAIDIIRRLRGEGYDALLAGGCVRDTLLDLEPKDFDVATSARPEHVAELFDRVVPIGVAFGVMLVVIDGVGYEVATFRRDRGYRDGRRPEGVVFSDAEGDALRRDFTINGLFLDPEGDEVIDFVGGRADLDRGIVRAIGDPRERFAEDRLRALRAVRFATRLGFEIEENTALAIQESAPRITEVSWERIRDELVGMFTGPRAGLALDLLHEFGLLAVVLPEVAAMRGVRQPDEFHPEGDVFQHTRMMLDLMEGPSPRLAMAVLLHDVGKPETYREADRIRFDEHDRVGAEIARGVCKRLRFSADDTRLIGQLVEHHMRFMHVRKMKTSTLKRLLGMEGFRDHLDLHRLDCLASHGGLENYEYALEKSREFGEEEIRPARLVRGEDLIEMGFAPGPLFAEILKAVEEEQLEGRLADRGAALAWIEAQFGKYRDGHCGERSRE